jgi:hypothetical protein
MSTLLLSLSLFQSEPGHAFHPIDHISTPCWVQFLSAISTFAGGSCHSVRDLPARPFPDLSPAFQQWRWVAAPVPLWLYTNPSRAVMLTTQSSQHPPPLCPHLTRSVTSRFHKSGITCLPVWSQPWLPAVVRAVNHPDPSAKWQVSGRTLRPESSSPPIIRGRPPCLWLRAPSLSYSSHISAIRSTQYDGLQLRKHWTSRYVYARSECSRAN